jgi:ComF family protein
MVHLIEHFFRLLAPSICIRCGNEEGLLCAWCREAALPEVLPRCYRCNKLSPHSATCSSCRRHSPIKHLFIRTAYSDEARQLVHVMKFKYSGEAADSIAIELVNTLPALAPETIVVPVPTITSHVRQRGLDHAARIAKHIAIKRGLMYAPALSRMTQSRQVGSKRHTRLTQMQNVFRLRYTYVLTNASVLLVDDVLTTGATIESAARELKKAGVKSIDAVIFARAG